MSVRRAFLSCAAFAIAAMPLTTEAQVPQPPSDNPFFEEWTTPLGVPPFDRIKAEHFVPAFKEAIARQRREVDGIASNADVATFANTIEAMDGVGLLLSKVERRLQQPLVLEHQRAPAGR